MASPPACGGQTAPNPRHPAPGPVQRFRAASCAVPPGCFAILETAGEGYVSERDPEAGENLCCVLDPEFMAAEAVSRRKKPLVLHI
jgi:hypothetical protein